MNTNINVLYNERADEKCGHPSAIASTKIA
jgi:hypothetical protein